MAGYGEGRVYQRGRVWWLQYSWQGRKIRESSHSTNKTDAERLLRRRLAEIRTGLYEDPVKKDLPFRELADLIRADYRLNQRKSAKRLEVSLKHLEKYFRGTKAGRINSQIIDSYVLSRLEEGVGSSTVNRELTALKRAFNLAKAAGYISAIPHIRMLKEPAPRQGFLEHDQYLRILKHLPPHLVPLFMLAYATGMRRGELLSLLWNMVNMREGSIRVPASITKSGEARTIFLPPQGMVALKLAMKNRVLGCDYVFHRGGKPVGSFYRSWKRACEAAGCPSTYFHDCRRTAIRNLIRAGVPERVAMEISGHKTRSVFDRYNITSERDLREAAIKLGDYLSRSQVNTNASAQEEGR